TPAGAAPGEGGQRARAPAGQNARTGQDADQAGKLSNADFRAGQSILHTRAPRTPEHLAGPSAEPTPALGRPGHRSKASGSPALPGALPLAPQDRVDQLVGPLALDELVLDKVCLAAHAVALHHPGGPEVAAIAPADDPVQVQAFEPEPQQ